MDGLVINSQRNSTPKKSLNIGTECEVRGRGRIKTSSSRQYRRQESQNLTQKRRIAEAKEMNESFGKLIQKSRERSKSNGRSESQLSNASSKSITAIYY